MSKIDILSPILGMGLKVQEVEVLENVQPDVEFLLIKSVNDITKAKFRESVEILDGVLDVTWEDLNTGHWSLVPDSQRTIYSVTSLLKVVALVKQAVGASAEYRLSHLEQAVKTADLGLLLGNSHRDQLTTAAHLLSQAVNQDQPKIGSSVTETALAPSLQVTTEPVCVLHCPSLETFSSQHFYPRLPVKITGTMSHWEALRRWSDLNYLVETAGGRIVPVELGSSYAQSDWSQRLMPLRQFVTQHVTGTSPEGIGYLAQHQLFDQVPELRRDITVPDYCACSETESGGEVDINAWFGPAGTVSPLHHDPKHNLLCQVIGRKQVTLYAPSDSSRLYPHEGRLLSNTARVDPEAPDYRLFPKYRVARAIVCRLSAVNVFR